MVLNLFGQSELKSNLLYLYFWGHLKNLVYNKEIVTRDDLPRAIYRN